MSEKTEKPENSVRTGKREDRLKDALRANLRRRKADTRKRSASEPIENEAKEP